MRNEIGGRTEKTFNIAGEKSIDSLNTVKWKDYLVKNQLLDAWKPVEGSPYQHFLKTKTIEAVEELNTTIKPRYSLGEVISERGVQNLIESGVVGRDTAVILDSGSAHSIAMAIKLAEKGYQPIVMLNSIPHPEGMVRSEQGLATLLYFAEQIKQLKAQGKIEADAPPAFILDTHRDRKYQIGRGNQVDNTYTFSNIDFPSAEELTRHGIIKAIYLNEGNQEGRINTVYQSIDRVKEDLKPVVRTWETKGVKMLYTGVSPLMESELTETLAMRRPKRSLWEGN
jgi:hypothetical protein